MIYKVMYRNSPVRTIRIMIKNVYIAVLKAT